MQVVDILAHGLELLDYLTAVLRGVNLCTVLVPQLLQRCGRALGASQGLHHVAEALHHVLLLLEGHHVFSFIFAAESLPLRASAASTCAHGRAFLVAAKTSSRDDGLSGPS
eukprot:7644310-Pyramimonas_sp.AAC.1